MVVVGVISDTHGLLRPEAVQALSACAFIVHAGDIGSRELLDELRLLCPVHAVRGNMDRGAWSAELPPRTIVTAEGRSIMVIHDLQELEVRPEMLSLAAVVSGHTHRAHDYRRAGVLYFNPGSAGPRRTELPASVGRLYVTADRIDTETIAVGQR
ncbi:MAG: YfcE family phosphodiesterase [Polyangiaceae bacterium]|nr:YfcE family phosphodiesterase [Polyangiaceae bacterium]